MRRQKACVIWHPVNPRALISTHTEVSGLQKSNWCWQPPPRHWDLGWVLHGSLWSISLGTIQGMAGTISKKPVSLLWAGGRFGWPRLPILARRWPRVDSEALGKCDLLFHSILHGPVSGAGFCPPPWSWWRAMKQWLLLRQFDSPAWVLRRWPVPRRLPLPTWPPTPTPDGTWCPPSTSP